MGWIGLNFLLFTFGIITIIIITFLYSTFHTMGCSPKCFTESKKKIKNCGMWSSLGGYNQQPLGADIVM